MLGSSSILDMSGRMVDQVMAADQPTRRQLYPIAIAAGLLGASLLWTCWPLLCEMEWRWAHDPRYSHGYLVPGFSLFLLWYRRDRIVSSSARPSPWGLALVAIGVATMLFGARHFLGWIEAVSLVPCLAGLAVLAGGWPALRWAWPSIGFLTCMIPLPYRIEMALGAPLQQLATVASTYVLQTIGLPAFAEGHIIHLPGNIRIGVAEACNGLGMLLMFFAYMTAAALILRRPLLERWIVVLSAIPIALAANVSRIAVTGLLEATVGSRVAHVVYHDLAGWLMMPMALAALWVELRLLSYLVIEPPASVPPRVLSRAGRPGTPAGEASRRPVSIEPQRAP